MDMSDVPKDTIMHRNAFLETDNEKLIARVKELEFDCAELQRDNEQMRKRIKTLASRTPEWPRGYKPIRRNLKKSG
jgi:hypothetical protein